MLQVVRRRDGRVRGGEEYWKGRPRSRPGQSRRYSLRSGLPGRRWAACLLAFAETDFRSLQICPIPASLASEAESTFLTQGSKFNYDFEEVSDPSSFHARGAGEGDEGKERTEYFKVDLPGGKSLVHWIKPGTPFSLQFGR